MKIYRAPKTSKKWSAATGSVSTKNLVEKWAPGYIVAMDATLDKYGNRHTDVGVELESDDIINAMNGLINYYINTANTLKQELETANKKNLTLDDGLRRIYTLITSHREDSPSIESLLSAIEDLAEHYYFSPDDKPPVIEWASMHQ